MKKLSIREQGVEERLKELERKVDAIYPNNPPSKYKCGICRQVHDYSTDHCISLQQRGAI